MSRTRYTLCMERTDVFILRIWREPREIAGAPAICRGVIEHVPTGERQSIQDLADILIFIARYVECQQQQGKAADS